jgi:dCTP deaminase
VAFWSGEKLAVDGKKFEIVANFDADKIDCSAYTLTLGPEAFVTPDYLVDSRDSRKQYLVAPFEIELGGGMRNITGGELIIPPGQFGLLLTEEFVSIPDHTMGFISLKFGVKGTGLINVSGFHVDPGYRGRLIFSVYNAGPSPIHMTRGQDLFLLWIADLDRASGPDYVKSPTLTPRVNLPEDMISKADRPIRSLQQLSERIDQLNEELTFFRRVVGVGVVLIGTSVSLAALIFAGLRFFSESPLLNAVK